jgi:hypothetical protein
MSLAKSVIMSEMVATVLLIGAGVALVSCCFRPAFSPLPAQRFGFRAPE